MTQDSAKSNPEAFAQKAFFVALAGAVRMLKRVVYIVNCMNNNGLVDVL